MNTREDIKLYNLDLTGLSTFNQVDFEYNQRSKLKHNDIFVVRAGPFYKNSFQLLNMQGKAYTYGKDYEFYGQLSKLTAYTAKEVGLFVRLKNDAITEWQCRYQVVGNFGIVGTELLKMMTSITEDDRLIDWDDLEDKPLWFDPELHTHDLVYDIFGFGDLVEQLYHVMELVQDSTQIDTVLLARIQDNIQFYCEQYRVKFREIVASHNSALRNNHSVDKEDIGLGLVDNFPIATIEEILDGTAQDRFLTPQLANRMVSEASGRNDLLYPGGSLPMLRYGNNSFIPPKIDGSFEGMGALNQKCAAVVEPSGELLVLTSRNNGVTRGLYFSSCADWDTSKPKWSFTSYQYKHPTATADGATLDFVMNGSNKYYMIVGDTVKNIFYGIETNGTLDPSKHTLKRLTGSWFSELRNLNTVTLLADVDYKSKVVIFQSINYDELRVLRPSHPTAADTCFGNRQHEGFLFYVIRNSSNLVETCIANYATNEGVRYNERVFTPYLRKIVNTPNGKRLAGFVSNFLNNYPVQLWCYYLLDATWRYNVSTGKNDFFFTVGVWIELENGHNRWWLVKYRASITIAGPSNPTLTLETKEYENKQYSFDPFDFLPGSEYEAFLTNKSMPYKYPISMYTESGVVDLKNGYRVLLGFEGNRLPNNVRINKISTYVDSNFMDVGYVDKFETISDQWAVEINPLGLGTGFVNQGYTTGDTDNYLEGGIIARQKHASGKEGWVFRKCVHCSSNWTGINPPNVSVVDGKNISEFNYDNDVRRVNLGTQLVLCYNSLSDPAGNTARERYRRIFGADAWSRLLGEENILTQTSGNAEALKYGDGLLVDQCDIKTINNVVTYIPKIVFNVRKAIDGPIRSWFTAAGITTNTLVSGWTLAQHIEGVTGDNYYVLRVDEIVSKTEVKICIVTLRISGKGVATTDRGYTYYDDVNVTKLSDIKVCSVSSRLAHTEMASMVFSDVYPYYSGCSISFCSASGKLTTTAIGKIINIRSIHSPVTSSGLLAMEAVAEIFNGGAVGRVGFRWGGYDGVTERLICTPGMGQGLRDYTVKNGGAGVIVKYINLDEGQDLFNNVVTEVTKPGWVMGISNIIKSQWTVYFQEMKNVVLSGKNYDIPAGYIDLRTIDPSPANKTFNVYLEYYEGKVGYKIYKDIKPESASRGLIATVVCGATQIATVTPWNRFSLDGVTWNINRAGSSIPAIPGTQYEIGFPNNFFRYPEDLLPE